MQNPAHIPDRHDGGNLGLLFRLCLLGLLAFEVCGFGQQDPSKSGLDFENSLLRIAADAGAAGHWQEAALAYQAVLDDATTRDSEPKAAAKVGLLRARSHLGPAILSVPLGIVAFVWDTFRSMSVWALVLLVCALVALWGILVRLFPKRGFRVSFEEISTDRESRLNNSRVLTALMMELLTPKRLSDGDFPMDIMPGTDEPGFTGVMPALERESTVYEPSDHPVKIASLEFVPSDVISLFGWLRRPPKESIEGWLNCNAAEVTASASYTLRKPCRRSVTKYWVMRDSGPLARTDVLALLTAQIIVDLRKVDFTRNGKSYHELRLAMRSTILDQTPRDRSPSLISSRRLHLEAALTCDPKNWIARFGLAQELCKGGFPQEAVMQYELLEKLIRKTLAAHSETPRAIGNSSAEAGAVCEAEKEAFQAVFDHLKRYPACPYLILYNKAIALAAYEQASDRFKARVILEELVNPTNLEGGPHSLPCLRADQRDDRVPGISIPLTRRAKVELQLNALSAKAHMISTDAWRRGEFEDDERKEIDQLYEEVERVCLAEQDEHWRSFQTARAVALGARGRASFICRNAPATVEALRKALAAEPSFAGARFQLAEAYLSFQDELSRDWAMRAKEQLLLALKLNDTCKQSRILLAATYSSHAIGSDLEAERMYRRLGTLPSLSLWLGRLIVNTKARSCPALFAVHQYVAGCPDLDPAIRISLDSHGKELNSQRPQDRPGELSDMIATAELVLSELESAGISFPENLLTNTKAQLHSLESRLTAFP